MISSNASKVFRWDQNEGVKIEAGKKSPPQFTTLSHISFKNSHRYVVVFRIKAEFKDGQSSTKGNNAVKTQYFARCSLALFRYKKVFCACFSKCVH